MKLNSWERAAIAVALEKLAAEHAGTQGAADMLALARRMESAPWQTKSPQDYALRNLMGDVQFAAEGVVHE
jgi:hypothetical protein